jgi:hypothetical protein
MVTRLPDEQVADRTAEVERLRRLFRFFAATQCHGRSPAYEALSRGVAEDEALLDLLMRTPGAQRRPSLLLAAVNLLLASHPGAALAAYYPVHGGRRPVDGQLMAAFAAFCTEHAEELGRLLRSGSTQTNEIRRCAVLRLALSHVSRRWPGPLALAEVGASAGLNLIFDRYGYRIGSQETGPAVGSPVLISCELRGSAPAGWPLGTEPQITSRLGIDLQPVQLADSSQRAWLEAFIWPEDTTGLATLRGAMDLAVSTGVPAVVRGDATTDTARLLAALPGREPVVVFTATLLSYLDTGARTAFASQLREAALQRPVAWAFAEAPGLMATTGLRSPAMKGPLARRNALFLVGVSLLGPGYRDDSLLAMADPYLRWLAPARHAADDFQWLLPAGPSNG